MPPDSYFTFNKLYYYGAVLKQHGPSATTRQAGKMGGAKNGKEHEMLASSDQLFNRTELENWADALSLLPPTQKDLHLAEPVLPGGRVGY